MERDCTKPSGEYTVFCGKGSDNHELGTGCFVRKRIMSAVRMVEFVSDKMLYIILRGRWFYIFFWIFKPQQRIKLII
jgi:hypothetical protein